MTHRRPFRIAVAAAVFLIVSGCGQTLPPDPFSTADAETQADTAATFSKREKSQLDRLKRLQRTVAEFQKKRDAGEPADIISEAAANIRLAAFYSDQGYTAAAIGRYRFAQDLCLAAYVQDGGKISEFEGRKIPVLPADTDSEMKTYRRNLRALWSWSDAELSRLMLAGDDMKTALSYAIVAVRLKPTDVAYYRLGRVYDARGRMESARTQYHNALTAEPASAEFNPKPLLALSELAVRRNDFAAARTYLDQIRRRDPLNPKAQFNLALLEMQRGNNATAAMMLEHLIGQPRNLAPDDTLDENAIRAIWWWKLGDCRRLAGEKDTALKAYRAALKLDPLRVEARVGVYKILKDDPKRRSDALRELESAADIRAGDATYQRRLLQTAGNDTTLAITALKRIVAIDADARRDWLIKRIERLKRKEARNRDNADQNVQSNDASDRPSASGENEPPENGFEIIERESPRPLLDKLLAATDLVPDKPTRAALNRTGADRLEDFRTLAALLKKTGRVRDALAVLDNALYLWPNGGALSDRVVEDRLAYSVALHKLAVEGTHAPIWSPWPELEYGLALGWRYLTRHEAAGDGDPDTMRTVRDQLQYLTLAVANPVIKRWMTYRGLFAQLSGQNWDQVDCPDSIRSVLDIYRNNLAKNVYLPWLDQPESSASNEWLAILALDGWLQYVEKLEYEGNAAYAAYTVSRVLAGFVLGDLIAMPNHQPLLKKYLIGGKFGRRSVDQLFNDARRIALDHSLALQSALQEGTTDSASKKLHADLRDGYDCALLYSLFQIGMGSPASIGSHAALATDGAARGMGRFPGWLYSAAQAQWKMAALKPADARAAILDVYRRLYENRRPFARELALKSTFLAFIIIGDNARAMATGRILLAMRMTDPELLAIMGVLAQNVAKTDQTKNEYFRAAYYFHRILDLKRKPGGFDVYLALGRSYENAGSFNSALAFYAQSKNGVSPDAAYEAIIRLHRKMKNMTAALREATDFHTRKPDDPKASLLLIDTLFAAGDIRSARAQIAQLESEYPGLYGAQLLDFRIALVADTSAVVRKKYAVLKKRNDIDDTLRDVLNALTLIRNGKLSDADRFLSAIRTRRESSPPNLFRLAEINLLKARGAKPKDYAPIAKAYLASGGAPIEIHPPAQTPDDR